MNGKVKLVLQIGEKLGKQYHEKHNDDILDLIADAMTVPQVKGIAYNGAYYHRSIGSLDEGTRC